MGPPDSIRSPVTAAQTCWRPVRQRAAGARRSALEGTRARWLGIYGGVTLAQVLGWGASFQFCDETHIDYMLFR